MSASPTQFYVGVARLPELWQLNRALVVELEVDLGANVIVGTNVSPLLPGMQRVVERNLVGGAIDDEHGIRRILEQYHSPMEKALGAAISNAQKKALEHS